MTTTSSSGLLPGEAELLSRLRAGSSPAFEELIRIHGVRLLATARRILRDEQEATDVFQDVLVSAFRSVHGFEGRCPIGAWLQRMAVNACLMRLRARRSRPEQEAGDDLGELLPDFTETGQFVEHQHPWSEPADAALERGETAVLVREAVGRLPDKYRVPLVLRELEGLDYASIAAELGVTENAAKIRVHRGRQALRSLLDPHMGPH